MVCEEGDERPAPASSIVSPHGEAEEKDLQFFERLVAPEARLRLRGEAGEEFAQPSVEGRRNGVLRLAGDPLPECCADLGVGVVGGRGGDEERVGEQDQLGLILQQERLGDLDLRVRRVGGRQRHELFVLPGVA